MQRTICSIWPMALTARRNVRQMGKRNAGFMTKYEIPAAPRDGFNLLTTVDMEEDFKFSSEAPRVPMTSETTGERMAACLVHEWAGSVAFGEVGGPGIFICMDLDEKDENGEVISPATKPSERELAVARAAQSRWFERLCLEADDHYRNGRRKLISRATHFPAAEWLGKRFAWMEASEQVFASSCPVCGSEIKAAIFVCPSCHNVIDPIGFARWKRESAATQAEVERLEKEAAQEPELVGAGAAKVAPQFPAKK